MIDLHCHILPGVDDGAKTIEESLQMAKEAMQQGIHTIVATPHHQNGKYNNEKQVILEKVNELNAVLKEQDIAVKILPGQEIRLYGEFLQDYDSGTILTKNETGKYVLVEFPSNHVPRYAESLLYDIQLKGLIPIIAHPERNTEIIERPGLLYNLIKKGALSQVTAASLTGDFGKKIKKFSMQLVEHNLAHMIASDAHNITTRSFKLREAYDVLEKEFGTDVHYLFQETVYSIISGQPIYKLDPEQIRKKKLFGIF
ncbi:tyrosine-protein phosphatase [Bacillus sp. OTU530]|uniref:tyrosine-protein phosphatase n=1 Tax=Bacillus sp. OTU530 TaxID=3043862 RepID=UPI00313F0F15